MLSLFDPASEADVKIFANSLQKKLKQKFNITLGSTKILHAIAEMNGHKNWSSLKQELDDSGYWLLNSYAFSGICSSDLARSFSDGLFAFLRECFAYKRLMDFEDVNEIDGPLEYQIVAIDEDATYCGLYFYVGSRVLCSLTRPGVYDKAEKFSINQSSDDLIEVAGIVHRLVQMVGQNEAGYEAKLQSLEHSIYPRRFQYDAADYVRSTGQREYVAEQDAPTEWIEQTEKMSQLVTRIAKVTEQGIVIS